MTVKELAEKLSLKSVYISDASRVIAGAYTGDLLSWVMSKAKSGNVWITIMSNINIVAVASLCDISMIILAENSIPDKETAEKAAIANINIYSSELTSYELCAKMSAMI